MSSLSLDEVGTSLDDGFPSPLSASSHHQEQ